MDAQEIFTKTKRLNISLWAENNSLKYEAPRDVLTDELRAEIRAHKPALLELLAHGNRYTPDAPTFWADVQGAINQSRRGAHLAYTPALARIWKSANALTKRDLTIGELCRITKQQIGQE